MASTLSSQIIRVNLSFPYIKINVQCVLSCKDLSQRIFDSILANRTILDFSGWVSYRILFARTWNNRTVPKKFRQMLVKVRISNSIGITQSMMYERWMLAKEKTMIGSASMAAREGVNGSRPWVIVQFIHELN